MHDQAHDAAVDDLTQPYGLSYTGPQYLYQYVLDVAQHQAVLHVEFGLPPVRVAIRVVDDFVAQVNASAARSQTPWQAPFSDSRAGDSVVVAKNVAMTADHGRVEILFDAAASILAEPMSTAAVADLVWLVGHEMSHPLFGQLRAVTGDLAAAYPPMSGRRVLRRVLLDALDEFRCERVAADVLEDLLEIDDGGTRRGVTSEDMGDRYAGSWGMCVRDTVARLTALGHNPPGHDGAWMVQLNQLITVTNDLVGLSARAGAYDRLTLARFDGEPDCSAVVDAMDAIWHSVEDMSYGYTPAEFAGIEESFVTVGEAAVGRMWKHYGVDVDPDDPRMTGLA